MSTIPHPRYYYYSFQEGTPRWTYIFFSLPIVVGVVWSFSSHAMILPIVWLTVLPIIALTDREVEVDTHSRVLVTRWMPYRLFTVWKTAESLERYEAVTSRRASNGGRGSWNSPYECEWLMLVRTSGKFRSIQFFHARKKELCPKGQAAARSLMNSCGLPYRSYPNRGFTRDAPVADDAG